MNRSSINGCFIGIKLFKLKAYPGLLLDIGGLGVMNNKSALHSRTKSCTSEPAGGQVVASDQAAQHSVCTWP